MSVWWHRAGVEWSWLSHLRFIGSSPGKLYAILPHMKYFYWLYCPDCYLQDFDGCFDGMTERDSTPYDTPQEAREAAQNATLDNIWEYGIVDEEGRVIKPPV